jgi:ketopantoate reductase
LARGGAELVCLDRSADVVAALQQHGILVRGVLGEQTVPVRATTDPAQLGLADMALVLVDAAATPAAAAIAKACLKPDGFALSLQNGIGNLEALVDALGPQRVMAGITYNSGTGEGAARSWHTHLGLTPMGEATGTMSPRLEAMAERFRAQGMAVELTDKVEAAIWSKFVHNCAINPISALTGLRPAQIMQTPPAQALMEHVPKYDLVIVIDFGHSMLSERARRILRERAKFLAVNAQCNAGNLGHHALSKYPAADFMTATETEVRIESRDRHGPVRGLVQEVYEKLGCKRLIVTRGKNGCICCDPTAGVIDVPAVAGKVVDRIGAGDAFLSVSSLLAVQGAPLDVVGLAGNAAGALAVATVANRDAIDRVSYCKQI